MIGQDPPLVTLPTTETTDIDLSKLFIYGIFGVGAALIVGSLIRSGKKQKAVDGISQRWPSSQVQSLLFSTKDFTVKKAKTWARGHKFRYGKVHTTKQYHRFRQYKPAGKPCRTLTFKKRPLIKAIICST